MHSGERIVINYSCGSTAHSYLLLEHKQSLNLLSLSFQLSIFYDLLSQIFSLYFYGLVESALDFGYNITDFPAIIQSERLAIEHGAAQRIDSLSGFSLIRANDKSLSPHSYVLFGMDFFHIDSLVTENLEQTVFQLRNRDFLIQVLNIYRRIHALGIQRLLFESDDLLVKIVHLIVFQFY